MATSREPEAICAKGTNAGERMEARVDRSPIQEDLIF